MRFNIAPQAKDRDAVCLHVNFYIAARIMMDPQQPDERLGTVLVPQLPICWRPSPSRDVQPHHGGRTYLSAASNVAANGQAIQMQSPAFATGARSSGTSINADRWFEDYNRNVCGPRNVCFVDRGSPFCPFCTYSNVYIEDPPFYLQQQPSSDNGSAYAAPSVPSYHRSLDSLHHSPPKNSTKSWLNMSESNSEDYRSVIDDLTVQNKKLKQRLRMYEKLHGSHLQGDKLFEFKVYGLPSHRKRELESILQSFTARLDEDLEEPIPLPTSLGTYPTLDSTATAHKPLSSCTLYSTPVDSAYASMSASGQTPSSLAQFKSSCESEQLGQSIRSKKQNIHSYLRDIPKRILPRLLPDMTNRAKKKLVVRRLEHLFTGTDASPGLHSQSLQQQEVSQSAAEADRTATEARGCKISADGVREARILPANTEIRADPQDDTISSSQGRYRGEGDDSRSVGTDISSDGNPNQRPTRPLDLDYYRAQVPAENIQYIRHLCIASPSRCATSQSERMHDWVYLNLLTNMAQLHTINVTPEFVRMAVVEVSTRLELSRDGCKIRWKGGTEGTRMSNDSSGRGSSPDNDNTIGNEVHPRPKRRKLGDNPLPVPQGPNDLRKPRLVGPIRSTRSFDYEPLFSHRTRYEASPEDHLIRGDSPQSVEVFEDEAVPGSIFDTGFLPALRKKTEEGPIIYYNKAPFCIDLSGDPKIAPCHATEFFAFGTDLDGCLPSTDMKSVLCPKNSPTDDIKLPETIGVSRQDMDIRESITGFEDIGSGPNDTSSTPFRLEASGIGGVQPRDNFSVNVMVRHAIPRVSDSLAVLRSSPFPGQVHRGMHQIIQCATDDTHHGPLPSLNVGFCRAVQVQIMSAETVHLPPSTLPPPSHVFHPFSSSDSDEEGLLVYDSAEEASVSARCRDGYLASPAGSPKRATRTTRQCSLAWSGSETDDSSIDLLAHAREYDPDTIAAQEREFEDNNGHQLGTNISRGSSTGATGSEIRLSGSISSPSNR